MSIVTKPIRIKKDLVDNKFYLMVGDQNDNLKRELSMDELEQIRKDAEWWAR